MDPELSKPVDAYHPLTQSPPDSPAAMVFRDFGSEIGRIMAARAA